MKKSKRNTPEDKTKTPEKPLRKILTRDTTTESKHWMKKEMVLETSDVQNNNTNKRRKLIKYELYREYEEVDRLCSSENLDKSQQSKNENLEKSQQSVHRASEASTNMFIATTNDKQNQIKKENFEKSPQSKLESVHRPSSNANSTSIFNMTSKTNNNKQHQKDKADNGDLLLAKYFKELNSDSKINDFEKVQLRPKSTFSSINYDNDIARIIHELVLNKYDKKIKDHKRRSLRRQKQQKELSTWSIHKSA
ncbi:unnamed protein product [Brassicogethes aeneus]|uniref:Uncharacterized protein n=1 Tax=Brassicogethes aeneus TaxID=1431903 RepID=A0A9P0FDY0_BRAAE|nr:unnamed protein product [Brassicogethes aeneus]